MTTVLVPTIPIKPNTSSLCGLLNVGNTCFINSVLQSLAHTTELNNLTDSSILDEHYVIVYENIKTPINILKEWSDLRRMMWLEKTNRISPKRMIQVIRCVAQQNNNELQHPGIPHDVSELIMLLYEEMHKNVSRPNTNMDDVIKFTGIVNLNATINKSVIELFAKEYSELWLLFNGLKISTTTKNNQSPPSTSVDAFNVLILPIPSIEHRSSRTNNLTVYDCLEAVVEPEVIEAGIDKFTKNAAFWNFPPIVTICIQRVEFGKFGATKNNTMITFPDKLDLNKYVVGPNPDNIYTYELYATCNHFGGTMMGHYTASADVGDVGWCTFDDESVHINQPRNMGVIYCGMYRRCSTS